MARAVRTGTAPDRTPLAGGGIDARTAVGLRTGLLLKEVARASRILSALALLAVAGAVAYAPPR
ncbi:hypothetical protein J0H58_31970 [bacterium]|nr:hypothetical protein [bacterium]